MPVTRIRKEYYSSHRPEISGWYWTVRHPGRKVMRWLTWETALFYAETGKNPLAYHEDLARWRDRRSARNRT